MAAQTQDRNAASRAGVDFNDPVAAGAVIYGGALVVLNASGYATPGSIATGLRARGVASGAVDNSGGLDGDANVDVRKGVFAFENDGVDPVSGADVENTVYITDDQTISKTDGTGTKSAAGKLVGFVNGVPWVQVG